MKVKVKRIFHGVASVRDYAVAEAFRLHEGLDIECNGEYMNIPYNRLFEGKKTAGPFKSKHDNSSYYLIDFPWKPTVAQESLL